MLDFDKIGILLFLILAGYDLVKYILNRTKNLNIAIKLLFNIYFCFLIKFTFFNIPMDSGSREIYNNPQAYNMVPFHTIISYLQYDSIYLILKQLVGNLLLLIPFDIYFFYSYKNLRVFSKYLFLAIIPSVLIEIFQGIIGIIIHCSYRSVDIDDIILNVLGALIIYYPMIIVYRIIDKK